MTPPRPLARRLAPAVAFLLGVGGLSPAQAPATAPSATSLTTRLSSPQCTLDEATAILGQLRDRTVPVRQSLFDALCKAFENQTEGCAQQRERLLQRFAKAVPATQRTLLGRGGEARVDALRKQARAITARPELTKEMIHAELDPLLAELRTMLLPTPPKVFEHDATLADEAEALRRQQRELDRWFDLCLEAAHALDGDADGRKHVARHGLPPLPATTDDLDAALLDACLFALPLGAGDRRALEFNETLRPRTDPREFAGTLELNRIRLALGLGALRIDEKLGNAARDHSQDMFTLGFFAHESPVEGKRSFGDRASRAGTSASSENIAQGQTTGEGAIEGWWYSPGHHKNMLGGHARTGLGRFEHTWTQLFGG